MTRKNLMPQAAQPVNRNIIGHLPAELAELSEEALQLHGDALFGASVLPSAGPPPFFGTWEDLGRPCSGSCMCSYDGDDAE
jgi:bacteriocin leader peptide (microcyclamide/patellamide family)